MPRPSRLLWCALAMLMGATLVSWIHAGGPSLRVFLAFLVIAEPWLLVAALITDPPKGREVGILVAAVVGGAVVQIPLGVAQFARHGFGDEVRGSLVGNPTGAHILGALAAGVALFLIGEVLAGRSVKRLGLATLLLGLCFLADAKQALFVFPIALLAVFTVRASRRISFRSLCVTGLIVLAGYGTFIAYKPFRTALTFVEDDRTSGTSGKLDGLSIISRRMSHDPITAVVGLGPGTTASKVALQTSDGVLGEGSAVRSLGFETTPVTAEILEETLVETREKSSFESGWSSLLGVFGDLGIVGLTAFVLVLFSIWRLVGSSGSPLAGGARGAIALAVGLGINDSWLEQPPFTVPIAVLIALAALSASSRKGSVGSAPRPIEPAMRDLVSARGGSA